MFRRPQKPQELDLDRQWQFVKSCASACRFVVLKWGDKPVKEVSDQIARAVVSQQDEKAIGFSPFEGPRVGGHRRKATAETVLQLALGG